MEGRKGTEKGSSRLGTSFATGAIALVFLIIGYQTAVFIHHAAVMKILADRDSPDTVFVEVPRSGGDAVIGYSGNPQEGGRSYRKTSAHHPKVVRERELNTERGRESFRFDPNTVSVEDLQRLGFSLRQAQSIDNYRKKGGRFRRRSDFAKSYVVADSVYKRLEPFIDIPKIDLNRADSADFETLPGIGGWFASRMVEYRSRLGGYSYKEQLMDIRNFDREKYEGLEDLVTVDPAFVRPYRLWSLPEDSLRLHPYIGRYAAHGIVLFRENNPREKWNVEELEKAGVLRMEDAGKLSGCSIAEP
ncbi:MAG: helix-hairpin-helix domain-containing protein [Bacteroidales bacterium]|nr:helix-hairpin-helix domain-containing protein [Bacteroidales bacterium]MBQ5943288.1 helix-hairpin-helix domain-containing protein [Bacteroidales bacterium]